MTFRLDYRLNGRRETIMLGRYSRDGLTLALARERCIDARRAVNEGRSPALEKQREKRRLRHAKSFGDFAETWFSKAPMADSTRAMRRAIYDRDIGPHWKNRLLTELLPDNLRAHCGQIVDRGAPATAIHVRDIVKQIFGFAILNGEKVSNPADEVGPAAIATFAPRDRSLSPAEIRVMLKQFDHVATLPTIRLGMRLFLLTMAGRANCKTRPGTRWISRTRCGDPQGANEALAGAQRLPVSAGPRHHGRAQDMRRQLALLVAVKARCRRSHVPSDVQPRHLLGGRAR